MENLLFKKSHKLTYSFLARKNFFHFKDKEGSNFYLLLNKIIFFRQQPKSKSQKH